MVAQKNHEQELFESFKRLASVTLENEKGCIRYNVICQISHPGTRGQSKYNILLTQEYVNLEAFDIHCNSEHVSEFLKNHIESEEKRIVEDWRCRIFSEEYSWNHRPTVD